MCKIKLLEKQRDFKNESYYYKKIVIKEFCSHIFLQFPDLLSEFRVEW